MAAAIVGGNRRIGALSVDSNNTAATVSPQKPKQTTFSKKERTKNLYSLSIFLIAGVHL